VWPPGGASGALDSSSNSSSPHMLNAQAQHRLDEIFKAHLPELLSILSQVGTACLVSSMLPSPMLPT
jgi:hypothetical protein